MNTHRIAVKFFLAEGALDEEALIPTFHGWIRRQALPGHILIDVADYRHVPGGPRVLLVAFEANLSYDLAGGPGLVYQRKRPVEDPVKSCLSAAEAACDLLAREDAFRGVKFDRSRVRVVSNDRLRAPNDDATFAAWKKSLAPFGEVTRIATDPRERLTVEINRDGD